MTPCVTWTWACASYWLGRAWAWRAIARSIFTGLRQASEWWLGTAPPDIHTIGGHFGAKLAKFGIYSQIGHQSLFKHVYWSYAGRRHSWKLGTVVPWLWVGRKSVGRHKESVQGISEVYQVYGCTLVVLRPELQANKLTYDLRGSRACKSLVAWS